MLRYKAVYPLENSTDASFLLQNLRALEHLYFAVSSLANGHQIRL